jgi:hypothetical protein
LFVSEEDSSVPLIAKNRNDFLVNAIDSTVLEIKSVAAKIPKIAD